MKRGSSAGLSGERVTCKSSGLLRKGIGKSNVFEEGRSIPDSHIPYEGSIRGKRGKRTLTYILQQTRATRNTNQCGLPEDASGR